jgi:hypothetical protein
MAERAGGGGGGGYDYLNYLSALSGRGKKHYESALPIILIAIIVIIALGKLQIIDLSWVPGIGGFFGGGQVKALVLADTQNSPLTNTLRTAPRAKELGILVDEELSSEIWDISTDYRIIFLTKAAVSNRMRTELGSFVSNGGRLVIVKDAGCQVSEGAFDPAAICPGWTEGGFSDIVPVDLMAAAPGTLAQDFNITIETDGMVMFPQDVVGVAGRTVQIQSGVANPQYSQVNERSGATKFAYFGEALGGTFYTAITTKDVGVGRLMHIAWDPRESQNQNVLWWLVDYLK